MWPLWCTAAIVASYQLQSPLCIAQTTSPTFATAPRSGLSITASTSHSGPMTSSVYGSMTPPIVVLVGESGV